VNVRYGEDTIMMALFGLLEKEEDREAMHRMMEEAKRRGGVASASPSPEGGGYTAYIEMPGSWLNIGFYGDRGASEQVFIIPFRDGDNVRYFAVRGVCEGDRRVTRCDMVEGNGLGSIDRVPRGRLGGAMGRDAIQAEGRRDEHAVNIITPHSLFFLPLSGESPRNKGKSLILRHVRGHEGV
jgi:hypothetical protein